MGFLGVDGEGYRDDTGNEIYWLLRCGDQQIAAPPGERLSTKDCLEFLFSCRKPGYFLVGFALNYDWDHILRDLTDDTFSATRKEKFGARYNANGWRYLIKRVKCKFVEVTRWPRMGGKGEKIRVFDVFSFFQCSFLDAITTWQIGTEEERTHIARMKGQRNDFASMRMGDVIEYNTLECSLLSLLMTKFDGIVQNAIGIRLASWHGPGALAKAALKKFDLAEGIKGWQEQERPTAFTDASTRAFFGGWFQLFKVGHFDHCYQVDINSAYPDQTRNLPALGGTVHHTAEYDPTVYACWHVVWDLEILKHKIHPFPFRTPDGRIHRPPMGNGWYWQEEVKAAKEVYGDAIEVLEGWIYTPPTDEKPFEDLVNALYATRLELGKAAEGIPIKLFLNSIYGVLAQSPIHGDKALGCPTWAGMITSGTRAKMFRAAVQNPSAVVYTATDGILTEVLPRLPYSKTVLGEWDKDEYTSAEVYQPGIYRLNGAKPKVKVRGMRKDEPFDWEGVANIWREKEVWGTVPVTTGDRYLTRDLAIHWGHTPYKWRPETKEIALRPGEGFADCGGPRLKSIPWETWDLWNQQLYQEVSAPYNKLAEEAAKIEEERNLVRENYTEE